MFMFGRRPGGDNPAAGPAGPPAKGPARGPRAGQGRVVLLMYVLDVLATI